MSDKTAGVVKRADEQAGEMELLIFANMREGEVVKGLRFLDPEKANKVFMDKFKEVYIARTKTSD